MKRRDFLKAVGCAVAFPALPKTITEPVVPDIEVREGQVLYGTIRRETDGYLWSPSKRRFEPYGTDRHDMPDYVTSLAVELEPGFYKADAPDWFDSRLHRAFLYRQQAPVASNTDPLVCSYG